MGYAARANHRAIAAGEKVPRKRRRLNKPAPPAGLVKRLVNSLLADYFGISGKPRVKPPTRKERYLQREARRSGVAASI